MKSNHAFLLFATSLLVFVLSLFLHIVSVHTYCENRRVAALFGVVSIIVFVFFFRGQAASTARKVVSGIGMALCVLALAINVAFIIHATRLCGYLFEPAR